MCEHQLLGKTSQIADSFEASDEVKRSLARRVASLCGTKIKHEEFEEIIIDRLSNNGQPDWESVLFKLGDMVKRAYKGKTKL